MVNVKELRGWLVSFERKNKEHFQRGQYRSMLNETVSEEMSGNGSTSTHDDGLEEDRRMIAATKMIAKSMAERKPTNESFNSVEKENLNIENSKRVASLSSRYKSDRVNEDRFQQGYEYTASNGPSTLARPQQQKSPMRRLQKKLPLLRCKSPSRVNHDNSSADILREHHEVSAITWQKIREEQNSHPRLPPHIPTQTLKREDSAHTSSLTDFHSHQQQPERGSLLSTSISALQARVINNINTTGDKTRERFRNEKSRSMATFLKETTLISTKSCSSSSSSSSSSVSNTDGINKIEHKEISSDSNNDDRDDGDASASSHSSQQRKKDELKPYASELCKALASSSRSFIDRNNTCSNDDHRLTSSSSTGVRYTYTQGRGGNSITGASSTQGGGQDGTDSVSTYSAVSRSHSVSTYSARSLSLSEISSTVADRKKFLQDVLAKSDVFDRKQSSQPQSQAESTRTSQTNSPVNNIAQKFGGIAERKSNVLLRKEELERQWSLSQTAQPRVPQAKWQISSKNGSYKKRVVLVEKKQRQQQQGHRQHFNDNNKTEI